MTNHMNQFNLLWIFILTTSIFKICQSCVAAVHTYIYTHVHCLANTCAPNKSTAIRSKQGQTQVSKLGSTQGQCTDKRVKKASDKAIQTANVENRLSKAEAQKCQRHEATKGSQVQLKVYRVQTKMSTTH